MGKRKTHVAPSVNDRFATAPSPSAVLRVTAACAVGAAVVLTIVLAVQWTALDAGALSFDDGEYLTNNPLVQSPSFASAGRFMCEVLVPSTVHGYYQPLTMISLMLDYAAGGRPNHLLAFHRTSLLLHLANTLLVMLLLYCLLGDPLAAGLAGLLFGVHPMTVETIVWVGERKTVLAGLFVLIAMVAYVHYTRHRSRWAYGASIVAFVLALMSKPTVTPLPVCLLLLDYWPLRRLSVRAIIEKWPYLLIAGVSAYITFESQRRTAVAVLPGQEDAISVPYVICHNIVFYLRQMVWPMRMSSHYAFPSPLNPSSPPVLAGMIGTTILIPLLVLSLRWTRALATGWLLFFVAIFPTLGVIGFTNVIAADKYAYWPAVGLLLSLAWLVNHALGRVCGHRIGVGLMFMASLGAVAALAVTTRTYLERWLTTESLFSYMVSLDEKAAAPLIQLGVELDNQGRAAEAIPYLKRAAVAAPQCELTFYNLGSAYQKLAQHDAAIASYEQAILLKPDFANAYNNLGNTLFAKGDTVGARLRYSRAIDLNTNNADAHYNLANVLLRDGDVTGAIDHYNRALRARPGHAAAHKNLAGVLWGQGRMALAAEHYEQALSLQPGYKDVAVLLANLYATSADPALHRPRRAVELAEQAVSASGRRNLNALIALTAAYAADGRPDKARTAANEAMRLAGLTGDATIIEQTKARLSRYLTGA